MNAVAVPADARNPDAVVLSDLDPWLSVVKGAGRAEHAVLCDGRQRLRIDLVEGGFTGNRAVLLDFRFRGLSQARSGVQVLQRLLSFMKHRRFPRTHRREDPVVERGRLMLQVHDAILTGASQHEVAVALYGPERLHHERVSGSDSLRSRVRRLAREGRAMAKGRYRGLMS